MEAAGIEPACRDRSTHASTCVAKRFIFDGRPPFLARLPSGYPGTLVSRGRARRVDPQAIRRGLYEHAVASGEQRGLGQPSSRQPKRSYLRQLKVAIGFLRGPPINHDTPQYASTIRSNPVRPRVAASFHTIRQSGWKEATHFGPR